MFSVMKNEIKKPFLQVLKHEKTDKVPFWFMRQAGRYLPEYMALRAKAGSFLNMAYNPDFACEVTMQPIRRFGMDAAIIFSDILVIPHALGQHLEFAQGEGPKLGPYDFNTLNFDNFYSTLSPVYQALKNTRSALKTEGFENTALIGFAGSPWTVATYMIEGGGSKEFLRVKTMAYSKPDEFQKLIDLLIEATSAYLIKQIEAGAEAIQIFDSWASALDHQQFLKWVVKPNALIVSKIKAVYPDIPVIGFPRAVGANYEIFAKETGVQGLSIDQQIDPAWAAKRLQPFVTVQGNLDPVCLIAGGEALTSAAKYILDQLGSGPFIFNLGHGINKDTPVENVELLVKMIKNYSV